MLIVTACATAPSEVTPATVRGDPVNDTVAVRAAVARAFTVPDSMVWPRVVIRGDTALAIFRSDNISFTMVRFERRNGAWVFVRVAGYGVS
ncbi:MAG: hypothetical protein ACSLFK_05100 [Gemmatimonadaceae bacterium]